VVTPAAEVYQHPQGADLPAAPFIFSAPSDPKVYLLDVPLDPASPSGGSGGGNGPSGAGGSGGNGAGGSGEGGATAAGTGGDAKANGDSPGPSGACAIGPTNGDRTWSMGLFAALALVAARRRRRG
jgi:MYXO-CTERM domain-containing protein